MSNRRELMDLLEHLKNQGARIQWSGGGGGKHKHRRASGFPAKVIPPDPDKPIITFHETASSRASSTLYRNLVRRSGLTWPGEDADTRRSRKETQKMTDTLERKKGEHLIVPAGVRSRTAPPLQTVIDRVKPYVAGLPDQFWTDQLVERMRDQDEPGFRSKNGASGRAQDLLDMLGYRVIETKPNRNGFSYRWALEADPQPGSVKTVPLPGGVKGPAIPFEPSAVAPAAAPAPEGFQVFQRPPRQKQHERVMCEDCLRHFTPDGLERHQEETGHGAPAPETVAAIEALRGGPVDLQAALLTEEAKASTALDGETFAVGGPAFTPDPDDSLPGFDDAPAQVDNPVDGVHTGDEEAALALAEAAESEAADLRSKLVDANELVARNGDEAERLRTELTRAKDDYQRQARELAGEVSRMTAEANEERQGRERAEGALLAMHTELEELRNAPAPALAPAADDGSWALEMDGVKNQYLSVLLEQAERMGLQLEVRARRA